MLKKPSLLGKEAGRYLLIATITGLMAGCGGSSGDAATPIGEQDFDNDGILNANDADADGDGLDDLSADTFVDLDSDGRDDFTLLTQAQIDAAAVVEVSAAKPCGGEEGTDNNSSDDPWNNNCYVKRESVGGQFADSLFSVGIQRVLFCTGFGTGTDYKVFADGEYGPGSEAATIAFQTAESTLTPDGVVGTNTWARLQERVEVLVPGNFTGTPDTLGFKTGLCANIPMFYQTISPAADSVGIVKGGWTLARNQPNDAASVPFSHESPFNKL